MITRTKCDPQQFFQIWISVCLTATQKQKKKKTWKCFYNQTTHCHGRVVGLRIEKKKRSSRWLPVALFLALTYSVKSSFSHANRRVQTPFPKKISVASCALNIEHFRLTPQLFNKYATPSTSSFPFPRSYIYRATHICRFGKSAANAPCQDTEFKISSHADTRG